MKKVRVYYGKLCCVLVCICGIIGQAQAPSKRHYRSLVSMLKMGAHKRTVVPFIQAFFPPQDGVEQLVCELVAEEDEQIDIATFQLTNKKVAQALAEAHKRGVSITIVADVGALGRFNRVLELASVGVPVFIYPKSGISEGSLMHNKIMIFHGLETVLTGSMNLTKAGVETNEENVLIIQYSQLFSEYVHQFKYLITRSTPLGNHIGS